MPITLFTDAGHCPDLRVGAWAAWAKESGNTLRHAGILTGTVPHSGEAEMKALHNGLFLMGRIIDAPAGSRIVCQTDCQEVLTVLGEYAKKIGTPIIQGGEERRPSDVSFFGLSF